VGKELEMTDEALKLLLNNGTLGIMSVLLVGALIYVFKLLIKSLNDRIVELVGFKEIYNQNANNVAKVAEGIESLNTKLERIEDIVRKS
jgi:hypothetical protein